MLLILKTNDFNLTFNEILNDGNINVVYQAVSIFQFFARTFK